MAESVLPKILNGTSASVTLFSGVSAASATTEYKDAVLGFSEVDALSVFCSIASPSGGALDVVIQMSTDRVTWYDYIHFTQSAAAAAAVKYLAVPALSGSIATIGSGTLTSAAPVLGSGALANGPWFNALRVVIVTGAGTNGTCAVVVTALCMRRPLGVS